ncbi:EH domain-containing protein 4, partial [Reticulomyxa filosa]
MSHNRYGALLWSLGKVVQTPEVMRVYISSFWEKEYQNKEAEKLFDLEKNDLLADLKGLPRGSAIRKVNEFVKRARRCKVHALICDTLRSKFGFFSKVKKNLYSFEKKQEQLLQEMASIFQQVSTKHNVPLGDFPNPQKFAQIIKNWEIWKFPQLKPQQISAIDEMLERGIPRLLEKIELKDDTATGAKLNWNPFNSENVDDEDGMEGIGIRWVISQQQKEIYDEKFFKLELSDGKAPGAQVKQIMLQTGLGNQVLGKVWGLADLDKDGLMNSEEFALCIFLLEEVKNGKALPDKLPEDYIPPSFRKKQKDQKKNPFDINI